MKKNNKFLFTKCINSKITTTISISLALFLLGLVIFSFLFANSLFNSVKENLSFDIVLQDSISKEEVQYIQNSLNKSSFTKSISYIPKEKAIKQLATELEQDPEEFLGFNPLPSLIVVHLKWQYANSDGLKLIKTYLKKFSNNIKATEYREKILEMVTNEITKAGVILLSVVAILLSISFLLINNTIYLVIYSKRFLVRTMQLVGAKKRSIYKPFMTSNTFMAIIASIIACGLLYGSIDYIIINFPDMNELLNLNSLLIIFGSVFIFGILLSSISTYFAINRYMNIDSNEFYK